MARAVRKKELTAEERLAAALVPEEEQPYKVPGNWCWVRGEAIWEPMETKKPTGEVFRYVDIESIDNKQQVVTEPKLIEVKKAPSRASRALHDGDTLFSMVRPYLKNIAFVDGAIAEAIASTGFYVCTPKTNVNQKYNYYMMISPYVVDGLNTYMKGDNSPSIRGRDLEQFPYPIPPLPEQQRIVTLIESLFADLDEAKEKLTAVVEGFAQRKAAILHQAFTGELTAKWREENNIRLDDWYKCTLGEIIKVSSGKSLTSKQMNSSGNIPVYGGNGVTGVHDKANVSSDTLVIGRVGFYCGSVHYIETDAWVTDNALIVSYDKNQLFSRYLFYLLKLRITETGHHLCTV